MKGLITQTLFCLVLIAVQGFYLAVRANSADTTADIVAMAQPSTAEMATYKKVVPEENPLPAINNQFVPGVVVYDSNFGGDEASRLAKDGVFIGSNSKDNYIDLEGGNVLFNLEKDVIVTTRLGKIYIGSGATVFVVNSGDDVVVYDLLQTKPKQVNVLVIANNKQRVNLEPGRMLVLTSQDTSDFEKLAIDCHRVAYRNAQSLIPNNSVGPTKTFAADFSIASALTTIQPLKRLTISKNREDKIAVERMLKGAVLLGDFAVNPDSGDQVANNSPLTNPSADPVQITDNHQ